MKLLRNTATVALLLISTNIHAQLNPFGSMYFQNQYLMNSAMAGTNTGWNVAAALKAQWTAIEGAPVMQAVTIDYGLLKKKVGLGFTLYNESAGIFKRTGTKISYAYHIGMGKKNENFIDLGLSAGIVDEKIDLYKVQGDLDDVSISNFNDRKVNFDGDFGIAFRLNRLTLQGSLPNLKRFLKRDLLRNVADRALFFSSISYKLPMSSAGFTSVEPKVVYRAIQNYKNIVDVGANVNLSENKLFFNAMYHSTNSTSVGIGTLYKEKLSILCLYTTNTSDLYNYSNGEVEIGIKLKMGK